MVSKEFFLQNLQKVYKFPSSSFLQGLKGDRGGRGRPGRVGTVVSCEFGPLGGYYTSLLFQMCVTHL